MANKVYESANYVIIEKNTDTFTFSKSRTLYNERTKDGITSFDLNESEDGRIYINQAEVTAGEWFLEDGVTPYTVASLRTFLRENTANFKSASGGSGAIGFGYTKTGQTISYATYDDGDLQAGRGLDFFTLLIDNPHGTRERFTDELGTQVYANNIIIDWTTYDDKTALGIHRTPTPNADWYTQLTYCVGLTVGTFSDWRMPNIREISQWMNYSLVGGGCFGWTPFNNGGMLIMTSNTYLYGVSFYYGWGSGSIATVGKTYSGSTIPVKYFTKSELGL